MAFYQGFLMLYWFVAAIPKHRKFIGENIRLHRKKAGLSQEKLAEKADLHSVYISQVERADRAVTIDSLLKITKALGIRLRDVIGDL
jgi:transcriptional regulator with XRE-family HTH domain